MILIQVAQTQLAALVSRFHSPSNKMERSSHLNTITNCIRRIHDSNTKLELITLASSGYQTTPSVTASKPLRNELEQFLISTGHKAKHWAQCVWDECESYMEESDRHYYPTGSHHIPAPSPLYCNPCPITPHHSKRRYGD